jgi:hypothetical protein
MDDEHDSTQLKHALATDLAGLRGERSDGLSDSEGG